MRGYIPSSGGDESIQLVITDILTPTQTVIKWHDDFGHVRAVCYIRVPRTEPQRLPQEKFQLIMSVNSHNA